MIRDNAGGFFPYTPATNLLYGLREALEMLLDEGLPQRLRASRAARRSDPACGRRRGGSRFLPPIPMSSATR